MAKGQNVNGERKNSVITITILILVAIIAIVGVGYQVVISSAKTGYVSLKPIDVTLNSDGEEHKVSVKVTLGGKSKNLNKLNMESVQSVVNKTVSSLDYNSIVEENGDQYIKDIILNNLKQSFGDDIESVMLDSLLTDVTIEEPGTNNKDDSVPSMNDLMDNFGWSKNK